MERISWDQYFMTQSHLLSLRSTCTRLAVGATIVRDKRIIAGGYNGSIKGGVHCIDDGCYVIDNHCVRTRRNECFITMCKIWCENGGSGNLCYAFSLFTML